MLVQKLSDMSFHFREHIGLCNEASVFTARADFRRIDARCEECGYLGQMLLKPGGERVTIHLPGHMNVSKNCIDAVGLNNDIECVGDMRRFNDFETRIFKIVDDYHANSFVILDDKDYLIDGGWD